LSYGELGREEATEGAAARWSFAGGVAGAIGEVGELSGKLLGKTAWGTESSLLIRRVSFGMASNLAELFEGAGKLLGVVGGVIVGVVQVVQGWKALNQGDVVFGIGSAIVGVVVAVTSILVAAALITPVVGLVIVVVLLAAGYIVSLFKHDKLQHWLDSCYFGKHELGDEKYTDLGTQQTAFVALAKGG
jgi:hypothetical protein